MLKLTNDLLREFLKNASRIAIVALGNELNRDDAAGILVGKKLIKRRLPKVDVFLAYQSPEAYLMKIIQGDYSHVIFIDAAEANVKPGEIIVIEENEIIPEQFSTHRIPLHLILGSIKKSEKKILFIGIQRKLVGIGLDRSKEVLNAVKKLVKMLSSTIKECLEN